MIAIPLYRGTNTPDVVWLFKSGDTPLDGEGSYFDLIIKTGTTIISITTQQSINLIFENETGRLRWKRTIDDSSLFIVGNYSEYTINRRIDNKVYHLINGLIICLKGALDA